jgi:soluble lytic murein transglycosylase
MMLGGRLRPAALTGLCLGFLLIAPAHADIYRYRDENGVWHFTNIKSDRRYKLYMRESRKKPAEYIKAYDWIIRQASQKFRVDPLLIKAVIRAESNFNRRAVSCKGAQGLMQLMPETANEMAVEDPFDPEENIFGGTRYLSLLLQRFQNDKRLALAAYNAGPESVENYRGVPPFLETKTFIRNVLHFYDQYRSDSE